MSSSAAASAGLLGRLGTAGGTGVVRMQNRVAARSGDVWQALTEPSRLVAWWGEIEGDLRRGGEYRARVHASGWEGTGRIEDCDVARRLLLSGREADDAAEQSTEITLIADGDQTIVVWEERGMPVAYLAGYGAGIQVHVEDLAAYLAGRGRCDAGARMAELFPAYEVLAATVQP